ncbi:MAG: 50S ribosomal protein L4 [Myxococcota bacterium]
MDVNVINIEGKEVGSVSLPDTIFATDVNEALLWEMVKSQRASRRAGTHKTKKRGEVRGTGAKPYKQKGTGRARQGSLRSPQFVGGGSVFGPQPRDYSYRLPRSARRSALRSALSTRAGSDLIVLDRFELESPRTKSVVEFLDRIGTQSALIVDVENATLLVSSRNLPKAKALEAKALNVYDILDHEKLVLTQAAIEQVIAKASGSSAKTAA